jgi:hypothetical protein
MPIANLRADDVTAGDQDVIGRRFATKDLSVLSDLGSNGKLVWSMKAKHNS